MKRINRISATWRNRWRSSGSHHSKPPPSQNGCYPKNISSSHFCCYIVSAAFQYISPSTNSDDLCLPFCLICIKWVGFILHNSTAVSQFTLWGQWSGPREHFASLRVQCEREQAFLGFNLPQLIAIKINGLYHRIIDDRIEKSIEGRQIGHNLR